MSDLKFTPEKLLLTPKEVMAIQMGLETVIEDIESVSKTPSIPFTPEARAMQREILENSKSASKKLEKLSGVSAEMEPYKSGDEDEFLTKES